MTEAAKPTQKSAPGLGGSVTVRFNAEYLAALDAWIARRKPRPSRAEAIRVLVKDALPTPNTTAIRKEFDRS
jgi:hypothetical protein